MTGGSATHVPGGVPTAHVDPFAHSLLPPQEAWPVLDYSGEALSRYPDYINAAAVLLDTAIAECNPLIFADHSEVEDYRDCAIK